MRIKHLIVFCLLIFHSLSLWAWGFFPPQASINYHFDAFSWNGTQGEVLDSTTNNRNATAQNGLTTIYPGHLCRAANFNGVDEYIESSYIYNILKGTASISFWIKTTQKGNNIDWKAPAVAGIEKAGSTDDIFWGWIDAKGHIGISVGNDYVSKSNKVINDGVYHHVVLTREANTGKYQIYIDGSLDAFGRTGSGVIGTTFSSIGARENTGGAPAYFKGQLDEFQVFNRVLNWVDVFNLYYENRNCPPQLDHIEITHNLTGSTCSASPVTVKACTDASCSSLLNSPLSLDLQGNGTTLNSMTFTGSSTLNINHTVAETLTLSAANPSIQPRNNLVCKSNQGLSNVSTIVIKNTNRDYLQVSEVVAKEDVTGKDVALSSAGATATARSTWSSKSTPDKAIDGVGPSSYPNIYHSRRRNSQEYLRIKLASPKTLQSLTIEGRVDCCSYRDVYDLYLYDVNGNLLFSGTNYSASNSSHSVTINLKNLNGSANCNIVFSSAQCTCPLGGFAITQPSYGLACPSSLAPIDIKALCTNGTTKTDYTGTVNLTSSQPADSTFYASSSGGTAINSTTYVSGDAGVKRVYLYYQNENHSLKVSATDTATGTTSTATQGTDFRTAGFVATRPTHFVCGGSSSMTLTAVGQNKTGQCATITGFNGNKSLKAWYQVNTTPGEVPPVQDSVPTAMTLAGQNITAQSQPATNNLNLNFNKGVATISTAYLDAGQVMSLNYKFDSPPYDGSVSGLSALYGSSSSAGTSPSWFVVRPDHIEASVSDPTNGKDPACASGDGNCTAFVKAGTNFTMAAKAVCSDTSKTVAKSYQGTVPFTLNLVAPLSGVNGLLGSPNYLFGANSQGVSVKNNQTESEVGVFKLSSSPASNPVTYFGQPLSAWASPNIGRFTPDHFALTLNQQGAFANSCTAGSIGFTYSGQSFSYKTAPSFYITAQNALNATTTNYTQPGFNKLVATNITRVFPTKDNVQKGKDNTQRMAVTTSPLTGSLKVAAPGKINADFNTGDTYTYTKNANAEISPFTSALSVNVSSVLDADGIAGSTGLPLTITPTGNLQRYGRWTMSSAFGPETTALSLPSQVEYLTGGKYIVNTDDNCTDLSSVITTSPAGSPAFSNIAVGAGTTNFSFSHPLSAGLGHFGFTAPGAGNTGAVNISVNLNTLPWLKYDWNGNGTLNNPANVSATFGQYRGNDRIIDWRELN